ncbi:MAG: hypothetical protein R3C11_23305 [Planctomycetaceae bacterium]
MGVVPFDESGYVMSFTQADGRSQQFDAIELKTATSDPQGRTIYRRMIVDAQSGNIVRHEMYGSQRELIATATMSDHRAVGPEHVIMPHQIKLEWPQTDMAFKLHFSSIELNPQSESQTEQWQIPTISKRIYDIGQNPVREVPLPIR